MEAWVSKEKRASTSVETLPGMIFRISWPNSTRRRSSEASTFESMSLPCSMGQFPSLFVLFAETYVLLAILNCTIDQLGVFRLFRSSEDERRVCGRILWFVFVDGYSI